MLNTFMRSLLALLLLMSVALPAIVWTEEALPVSGDVFSIQVSRDGSGTVVAPAAGESSINVLRNTGGGWSSEPLPADPDNPNAPGVPYVIYSASTFGGGSIAAGDGGKILRSSGSGWSFDLSPTSGTLSNVQLVSSTLAFVAGEEGILKWENGAWALMEGTPSDLLGLSMVDSGFGFACSQDAIYRTEDGWSTFATAPVAECNSVSAISRTLAFAAGGSHVFRWENGEWREESLPTDVDDPNGLSLNSIAVADSSHAWAVGRAGVILAWDGTKWIADNSPTPNDLSVVDAFGSQYYITGAAGKAGTAGIILHGLESSNRHPVPRIIAPTTTSAGALTTFNASASYDPDGTIAAYSWLFFCDNSADAGAVVSHSFQMVGECLVVLTVTDNAGLRKTARMTVTISSAGEERKVNLRPAANARLAVPAETVVNDGISLDGAGFDADGAIVLYEWDFDGDGTFDWSSSSSGSTVTRYERTGVFRPALRVTDNDSATDIDSTTVVILATAPRPPEPPILGGPLTGGTPTGVTAGPAPAGAGGESAAETGGTQPVQVSQPSLQQPVPNSPATPAAGGTGVSGQAVSAAASGNGLEGVGVAAAVGGVLALGAGFVWFHFLKGSRFPIGKH